VELGEEVQAWATSTVCGWSWARRCRR